MDVVGDRMRLYRHGFIMEHGVHNHDESEEY